MITVYITSYKYGHLVAHCIDSVLSQTKKPDQIIVVDDGAHDGVKEIADKLGVKSIIRPTNLGTAKNFDDLVKNTSGRMMFLGADNWLRPDALELMASQNADIVSSDIAVVGDMGREWIKKLPHLKIEEKDGYPIWRFEQKDINQDNYIHGSSLFNADMVKECRGNSINNMCVDWEMWKDILNAGGTHAHIAEPLLYYRRHSFNFSQI